jgi:hypothetical protein
LADYSVSANGKDLLSIESSSDEKQIHISKINPFNPIFLDEGITPEDASKEAIKFFTGTNDYLSSESGEFWGDLATSDVGAMLIPLFQYMKFEKGLPGLTQPINLLRQNSALPLWEKNLNIDRTIFADEIEFEEQSNFTRLLSSLTVGPGELVRDELRRLCYIGPLREVPKRGHRPATSPDASRWANGLAAYDTLSFGNEEFIDRVNEWLVQEDRLNSGYSVEVKKYRELAADNPLLLAVLQGHVLDEDVSLRDNLLSLPEKRRLLIREEANNIELTLQDIGVGISQVLPVVVAALHHKTGIVAIEQPELHIHPAFQVALGDLFIEQIRQYPGMTFILETHSEHLMLRFLRRIRETSEQEAPENRAITPAELSVYFVEPAETGISCHHIRVDEDGDFLDRWPRGFFTERAGELF